MIPVPAVYDKNLFLKKQLNSHYFDAINPDAVKELYKDRPSFDYIKDVAVALLEKNITDQLDVIPLDMKSDYISLEELSENLFSWSRADYLRRRKLKDCIWADVVLRHSPEDCLEKFKLQVDLKYVKKFFHFILQTSQYNYDLNFLVWKPLLEAEKGLNVLATLEKQNEELKDIFQESRRLTSETINARRTTKEQNSLWNIEESMIEAQIVEPILTRYNINWHQCKSEQVEIADDIKESYLQRSLSDSRSNIDLEEMSGDTIRGTYYALSEQYKQDFERLQNRFNIRIDYYENQINYKQLEIAKVRDQEKALRRQIERFHEEIKLRLEKEQRILAKQMLLRRSTVKSLKHQKHREKNKNKKKIKIQIKK